MNLSFISCNRQHGEGLSEKKEAPARKQQSACDKVNYKLLAFDFLLLQIGIENVLAFLMAIIFICGVTLL